MNQIRVEIPIPPLAVIGRGGMVATSQPLATAPGLRVCRLRRETPRGRRGRADAPSRTSTGIGGDCFRPYYEVATRQVYALDGSGRAGRTDAGA